MDKQIIDKIYFLLHTTVFLLPHSSSQVFYLMFNSAFWYCLVDKGYDVALEFFFDLEQSNIPRSI